MLRASKPAAWLGMALACACLLACGTRDAPAPTGEALYRRHCAACHGESGTGDGPLVESLREPPADLTAIAKREGGRFDEARVMRIIDGRRVVDAHGPREMPVWGAVFSEELAGQRHAGYAVLLNARALTDYVRSLQKD